MASDDFVVSVTNSVLTDLAAGRPWQVGAYIRSIGVYAPAAATGAEFGLFADGVELLPRGTGVIGIAPSATPAQEWKGVDYTAERQWRLPTFHTGASAQNVRVQVEYETEMTEE